MASASRSATARRRRHCRAARRWKVQTGTVKVTPNGGALQLAIQASGQGASLQSLGAGGLVQSVALSGNRNLVQNLAALEVMLKDRPGADPALNCAWEQLRALRPSGY